MDDDYDFDGYGDYDDYIGYGEDSPEYATTFRDIERTQMIDPRMEGTGGFFDSEIMGKTAQSMARTAREKMLLEIDRQITLPVYDIYKIDPADIRVGLQIIDRIEFYNPETLVAAAIFKTTGQPLDKRGISSFKRSSFVSDYNLYRYYRFLDEIGYEAR